MKNYEMEYEMFKSAVLADEVDMGTTKDINEAEVDGDGYMVTMTRQSWGNGDDEPRYDAFYAVGTMPALEAYAKAEDYDIIAVEEW